MKISKKEAAHFLLYHQNLLPPRNLEGKDGILQYINRVGCIQYDPLNMVGYNPNLVLQSRIKNFTPKYLDELLYKDRQLIDGWDKNMSIYSTEDWPYFSRYREEALDRYGKDNDSINEIIEEVRTIIDVNGPTSSIDLKFDTKVDWAWAPTRVARAALESMYFWGELVIHHKVSTRKLYDFTYKHIPQKILTTKDPNETINDYLEWKIKRRIRAVGLLWGRASDAWLGIHWMKTRERNEAINRLKKKGEIIPVEVDGVNESFYIGKEEISLMEKVIENTNIDSKVSFIAPLDNLLWDRKLIKEIFGFEYIWEVYKPVSERKYGYYVLPVLYGDKFVARFEPKFNKNSKKLEILNWWWESDVLINCELKKAIDIALSDFLKYLNGNEIQFNYNIY